MGTEFEDENAKEKLKAMLNRQFGIGDVSYPVRSRFAVVRPYINGRFRVSPPERRAVALLGEGHVSLQHM